METGEIFSKLEDIVINKGMSTLALIISMQKITKDIDNELLKVYLKKSADNIQLILDAIKEVQQEFYGDLDG